MLKDTINNEYFEWLYGMVCDGRYSKISYRSLLMFLHHTEFKYAIPMDENRAHDGEDLRYRFCISHDYDERFVKYINGPCSVLEMMVALAIRCEENIMDDTRFGDRTGQWFWGMINNLGLGNMTDSRFNEPYVRVAVNRFLDRRYDPDGKGGLFTIRDCKYDLRDVEIWYQLSWYLDSIV